MLFDDKLTNMSEISEKLIKIDKKARLRSRLMGYFFSTLIMAELGIIGVGTFSVYSWDIMEPISYLMLLSNFTFGFGWYVTFLKQPEFHNPINWYRTKVNRRMQARQGISDEEVQKLINEIMEIKHRIRDERSL